MQKGTAKGHVSEKQALGIPHPMVLDLVAG